jgi:MFS transporter, putative metabolite:H+ symporter
MNSISYSNTATTAKTRMSYTEFLDSSPMTSFLWLLVLGISFAQFLDGMDFQITSFALPGIISDFKINPAQAGLISSFGNAGVVLGSLLFPLLCDRIGRKPVFQWVLFTFAFGTFLSAIAPSYRTLLGARFVAGFGIGAEMPVACTILAEYAPKRLRDIFVPLGPIFFAVGWPVAALISIWIMPTLGWRIVYLVGIVPALVIIFVRIFLPESIRYLLSKGRTEEASKIVHDLARKAGRTDIELIPPVIGKSSEPGLWQQIALLRKAWGPILALAFFYFCFLIQTWGINAWLPTIFVRQGWTLVKSFSFTMIIFAVTPFSHVIAIWLHSRINRKWALFTMTLSGSMFFVVFGMALRYGWPVWAVVGAQVVQTLLLQGVISIFFTLCAELFPTPVRTFGIGFINALGRLGGVVGPFLLGLMLQLGVAISTIIYFMAMPLVVAAVLALFAIKFDSRRLALEEICSPGNEPLVPAMH